MWDFSAPTRDRTGIPCIARWILNRWTTREVPGQKSPLIARFLSHWRPPVESKATLEQTEGGLEGLAPGLQLPAESRHAGTLSQVWQGQPCRSTLAALCQCRYRVEHLSDPQQLLSILL